EERRGRRRDKYGIVLRTQADSRRGRERPLTAASVLGRLVAEGDAQLAGGGLHFEVRLEIERELLRADEIGRLGLGVELAFGDDFEGQRLVALVDRDGDGPFRKLSGGQADQRLEELRERLLGGGARGEGFA